MKNIRRKRVADASDGDDFAIDSLQAFQPSAVTYFPPRDTPGSYGITGQDDISLGAWCRHIAAQDASIFCISQVLQDESPPIEHFSRLA